MNQQVITKRGDIYDTLEGIDRGSVTRELKNAMRECTLASISTLKKSTIVLEITIDPDTKTEPLAMRVSANVKMKKPATPKKAGIFYPTQFGDLSREHPHQQRDLKDYTLEAPGGVNGYIGSSAETTPHDPHTGEILSEGGGN